MDVSETSLAMAFLQSRWNALILKKAVCVELVAHGIRWLHPTKGWKYVSSRRLGYEVNRESKP